MTQYLVPALIVGFFGWRWWSFRRVARRLPELQREGAQLVDVRTPGEFAAAHAPGSVNIPLGELSQKAGALDKSRPVVVACASGTRSAAAAQLLRGLGFARVLNAGPWTNLRG